MLKSLELSSVSVMVLLELLVSIRFKPEKWSNLDQASEVWPLTWKLITSESSFLEMIGIKLFI